MIVTTLKVEGLRELNDALKSLPREVSAKLLDRAVGAGAKVIRDEVALKAPVAAAAHFRARGMRVPPGTLKRAVYATRIKELATFFSRTWYVGVRQGRKQRKASRDAFYWWWVENGHAIVPRLGRGTAFTIRARRKQATGRVTAHPFLRPSFERKRQAAYEAMRAFLEAQIPKVAERLARKG